ncbi:hypothetical protein PO883_23580 [Massilia sp. DJPM01]|uniref:hypothetical protein n=1 Tax=Massilia sp. DJPM01 TaxID=3024404 RepID=UPI00259F4405|nr:hypothetical protein [Massilia sp. DJPM01]MDM5180170.1 hypothetical protein [Massilia sp. DJPM01]
MNNDDMSDEEFDAFLRGEDDLSRRLQGVAQPAPGAQLDAAILGYVKAGLAQEARPAAANDATGGDASPRLAPGLGRRWRIPAGIAAGVLAGVLGHQLYQGRGVRMESEMTAAQVVRHEPPAAMAPEPAPMAAPPPPPVMAEAPSAPVTVAAAPALSTPSAPPPVVDEAKASAAAEPKQQMQDNYASAPAPALARVRGEKDIAADLPAMKAAAAPPSERVAVDAKRSAETSTQRFSDNAASPGLAVRKENEAFGRRAGQEAAHAKRARDWLSVIDAMLKADLKSDALAEWTKFRVAYPDYPVPDEMLARIAAIKR